MCCARAKTTVERPTRNERMAAPSSFSVCDSSTSTPRQNRFARREEDATEPLSPSSNNVAAVAGARQAVPRRLHEHMRLVVTVKAARALNDTQIVLSQDPFVRATWAGSNASAQTEYVQSGGTDPVWESGGATAGGDGGAGGGGGYEDPRNVLALDTKRKARDFDLGTASLQRQSADAVPNSLLLEVLNSNFFFDDLVAFAVLVFSDDHRTVWVHQPSGGSPAKATPACVGDGAPVTVDLAMPLEVGGSSSADLNARRERSGGKLVINLRFESARA